MSLQSPTAGCKTITGYILPEAHDVQSNQDDVSASEDEEEEPQPEFLDMGEMDSVSSGGNMFKSSALTSKEVSFLSGNKKYRIEGRFPLCDPWWEVTCTVRRCQYKMFVKGYPSYSLRTDLRSESRSLVSLFLKACGALPELVTVFMQWLPIDRHVELIDVLDVLEDFEDSSPENKAVAVQLMSSVKFSVAWTHIKVASLYPGIMKYIPTLLPRQFLGMINKERIEQSEDVSPQKQNNTDVLAKLEELIKTDVWKLGFNYIMFKELHLIRCEATMEAFKLCNLFWSLPYLQCNALLLYTELKRYCRATGSTYDERNKLVERISEEANKFGEPEEALHFLLKQGVLIRDGSRVALRNLFGYEKGIAECVKVLLEGNPWQIRLDVGDVLRSAQMDRLRAKALEKSNETRKSIPAQNEIAEFEQIYDAFGQSSNIIHNGDAPTHCDSPQSHGIAKLTIEEEWLTSDSDSSDDSTGLNIDPSAIELDPDQVRAAEMMCANPVTVISGKGGCGKTTVVSLVFKAAMEQQTSEREEVLKACEDFQNDSQGSGNELLLEETEGVQEEKKDNEGSDADEKPVEVLLTAPTGRAASLLTKRTGFTAYTMHQVLWSFMKAKKDPSGHPEHWKFSQVRVLVVDEGSLVSVQILHSVLSMLTSHAHLQKFILLGDVRQLPSIEPGNTLFDLFEGLSKVRWAIEMKTNHRAESELIVKNAGLISEMVQNKCYSPLEFDAIINMKKPSRVPSDKRFIFVRISEDSDNIDLQNAIIFLLKEGPGLESDKSSQFVAFRRMDCELINELCCKHYSDHVTKTLKNKLNFQPHDKVCCTKNGYVTDCDKEQDEISLANRAVRSSHDNFTSQTQNEQTKEKRERLCNGEIFFIKHDETKEEEARKKRRYLTLDDGNDRVLRCNYRELQRECKLHHAWARTIHTFQGSEAETIVYVLGDSKNQNWQHVYTAVTRGQKRVYVVGREQDLQRSIKRWIIPRHTRLSHFVKAVVGQQGPEDTLSQSCTQSQTETPVKHSFGPSQSTPVAPNTPSRPQMFSNTQPSCVRHLYKLENKQSHETSNMSAQDDITFSQTYSWSPMDSCDEPSQVQNENVCQMSNYVEDATLSEETGSSLNESSRGSKRLVPEDACSTPTKLPKQTTSEESPLVSSRLNLLSIRSPGPKSNRKLFPDN